MGSGLYGLRALGARGLGFSKGFKALGVQAFRV